MNKIVLMPVGILVFIPCASPPMLFVKALFHNFEFGPWLRGGYPSDVSVIMLVTALAS